MDSFEAMMREKLMKRQMARMENDERQKENEIDIKQFPQLKVRWISGGSLQEETVSSDPSDVAACMMRHQHDGELSICSLECEELMIANQGYVMMSRDLKYWQELNSQLNEGTFEEGSGCMKGPDNDSHKLGSLLPGQQQMTL